MRNSKTFFANGLLLQYVYNKNPLIGFSVSKKYGSAVKRNLFKRRCRSAYKKILINKNCNVSIVFNPKEQNISNQTIVSALASIYEKNI